MADLACRQLHRKCEKSYVDGKHKHTVDATTATAVGKLLRASIIITGVLMLLQAFGFSISGVLALVVAGLLLVLLP